MSTPDALAGVAARSPSPTGPWWHRPASVVRRGLDKYAEAGQQRLRDWDHEYYARRVPSALMLRAWRGLLVFVGFRAPEEPEIFGMDLGPEPVWEWDMTTGRQVFRGNRRSGAAELPASRPDRAHRAYAPPSWHPEAARVEFRPVGSSFHIIGDPHPGTLVSLDAMAAMRSDIESLMRDVPGALEWPIEVFPPEADAAIELQASLMGDISEEEARQPSQSMEEFLAEGPAPRDRIEAARSLAEFVQAMHSADVVLGGVSAAAWRIQRHKGGLRLLIGFDPRVRIAGLDSPAQRMLGTRPAADFTDDRRGLAAAIARIVGVDLDEGVAGALGPARSRSCEMLIAPAVEDGTAPYAGEWLAVLLTDDSRAARTADGSVGGRV